MLAVTAHPSNWAVSVFITKTSSTDMLPYSERQRVNEEAAGSPVFPLYMNPQPLVSPSAVYKILLKKKESDFGFQLYMK